MTNASLVLFHMLENLPMAEFVSGFAIVVLLIFFITSSDSGSLVVDTITAGGKLNAPVPQRVFWATLEGRLMAMLENVQPVVALPSNRRTVQTGLRSCRLSIHPFHCRKP